MEHGTHDDPILNAIPPGKPGNRARTGIDLDDLRNPVICEAFTVWQSLCAGRRMPSRAEMTPRAMKGFLKFAALLEVLDEGSDFRFRVAGDAVNIQQSMSLTGMTTADIDARVPGYGARLRSLYARVHRRREAFAYRGTYFRPGDKHSFAHESVMLPLGTDGETVDHVLVVAA
jgi:hypothetical protein